MRYFWYFSFHNEDLLSNTTHLRDHLRRLHEVRDGRNFGFDKFLINRENLRRTAYSTRGRLSRAMLSSTRIKVHATGHTQTAVS